MNTRINKHGREVYDVTGDDLLVAAEWLLDAHEVGNEDNRRFLMSIRGTVERAVLAGMPAEITVKQWNYLVAMMRKYPSRRTF